MNDSYAARIHCQARELAVTGTIGILRRLYQEGVITQQLADEKLAAMMAAGFYSPIRSFKDFM